MKIGLMGTHGTGKTTLATQIAESLREGLKWDVQLVTGIARSCPWPINREATEAAQRWIYHKHMLAEIEAEQAPGSGVVICDRTALDSMVYSAECKFDNLLSEYLSAALAWMKTYTVIYWLRPVSGRLVNDGRRETDPEYQALVDGIFEKWIKDYKIPVKSVKDLEGRGGIWAAMQTIQEKAM